MAKIICKSGYLRTQAHVLNLLEYAGNKIAYQELVYKDGTCEKFSTNEKLEPKNSDRVQSVRIHFKDGAERVMDYSEYVYCITKTVTLDQVVGVEEDADPGVKQPHEMKDLDMMRYLGYIEGRPGVEKEDGHGLFGVSGDVPISVARQMAEQHSDSTIWSHIISMDEIEAKEKGYDQRSAWKDLVLALSPRIAKIYNITPENLVINAAFHGNTDNPHIHMMFYSTDPREGKVFGSREENEALKKASRQLKSLFVNAVFQPEARSIQERRGAAQEQLKEILRQQVAKELPGAVLEQYQAVAVELKQHSGRLEYGYLTPELKQQVNELLRDLVEQTPALAERSEAFLKMQEAYVRMYVNKEEIVAAQMDRYKNEFFAPTKASGKQANTVLHNILIKSMVREAAGQAFSDGAFMLPQHNMILCLADNLDETFAQAAQHAATEQVKALRQEINRQYYKVFCLPKEKREAHVLYKMLLCLPEQENLKVGVAQQLLEEVLQTPEQKALYSAAFETFKAEYTRLGGEQDFLKTSAAFNKTVLTGKYESVFSNLEFVRDNCEETIRRIEKQQLEQKVVSSCCLLARIMDTDARNQNQTAKQWRRFKRRRHKAHAQENSIER